MKRFTGKTILVTGSSRGIGKATALRFAREGGTVIIHDANENDDLNETYEAAVEISPSSIKLTCELSHSMAIRDMFKKIETQFQKLDVLVNNAATQNSHPFMSLPEDDWDRILSVNLKAPFLCGQLAAKLMIRNKKGKIINIGSVHEFQTKRNYTHYSSSKGGLVMLTKNMALELAEHNIQVNQIAAGAIATGLTDPNRQKQFLTAVPAGKVGQPEHIAASVCFLASSDADYITGISLTVDGGLTLGFCASRPDL